MGRPPPIGAFLDPGALARWWPGSLSVEPEPGGRYVVEFVQLGQTMRGSVVDLDPRRYLVFTWSWDHEPTAPARQVEVVALTAWGNTQIVLRQGTYADTAEDRAAARSHAEGWGFFLPALGKVLTGPSVSPGRVGEPDAGRT